jgi:tetratricopeptide (TPR) repeat protein
MPTMTPPTKSRREVLEGFVQANPNDAFARYGLALECAKLGEDEAATGHFVKLIESHPGYVAGYFQYGQLLARLGRIAEAKKTLSDGIVVAAHAGDTHARDEMQATLQSLA